MKRVHSPGCWTKSHQHVSAASVHSQWQVAWQPSARLKLSHCLIKWFHGSGQRWHLKSPVKDTLEAMLAPSEPLKRAQ